MSSSLSHTATVAEWRAIGASVIGTSHAAHGTGCEDILETRCLPDGWLAIAIADGAGSAGAAELGAQTAVTAVLDSATALTAPLRLNGATDAAWAEALAASFAVARSAVAAKADAEGRKIEDLASTLILALFGPATVIAAQVGDGAVVLGGADDEIIPMLRPDNPEFIEQTVFLIAPNAEARLACAAATGVRSAALFTDGLQLLTLTPYDWDPHPPFFRNVFGYLETQTDPDMAARDLVAFLETKVSPRTKDDVTLCVVNRTHAEAAATGGLEVRRLEQSPKEVSHGSA